MLEWIHCLFSEVMAFPCLLLFGVSFSSTNLTFFFLFLWGSEFWSSYRVTWMRLAQDRKASTVTINWYKIISSEHSTLTNQLAKICPSREVCIFPLLLKDIMICFHLYICLMVQGEKHWIWSKTNLDLYPKSRSFTSLGIHLC